MKVLYVGRDTSEKRAHLFALLAKKVLQESSSFEFTAVGELSSVIPKDAGVTLTGPLLKFEEIEKYYRSHHIVVITSEREGFPMAIMEGMAFGMVALSSPVGDVPLHIQSKCGYVTSSIKDEQMISEMKNILIGAESDRTRLKEMSSSSYEYAKQNFSREKFFSRYREVLDV